MGSGPEHGRTTRATPKHVPAVATPCTSPALKLSDRAVEPVGLELSLDAGNPWASPKHRRHYSMPQPRRRRHGPQPDRRRTLELLAASHDGATEAIMLAHGFTVDLLVELIRAGLATATAERL